MKKDGINLRKRNRGGTPAQDEQTCNRHRMCLQNDEITVMWLTYIISLQSSVLLGNLGSWHSCGCRLTWKHPSEDCWVWSMEAPPPQHTGPKGSTAKVLVTNTRHPQRSYNHALTFCYWLHKGNLHNCDWLMYFLCGLGRHVNFIYKAQNRKLQFTVCGATSFASVWMKKNFLQKYV